MSEEDCNLGIANASEWMECGQYMIGPVQSVVMSIVAVSVAIAILLVGLKVVRKVVREFGASV